MNNYADDSFYLNYTQVTMLYGNTYNLAPRMHIASAEPQIGIKADTYFLDFEREKDINLGVFWQFNDLKDDECVIMNADSAYGLKVGDQLLVKTNYTSVWFNTAKVYNRRVPEEEQLDTN